MNLFSLLDRLSTADTPSDADPRRQLLRQLGQFGVRAAVAASPFALAMPAQAAPTNTSFDAALLLYKLDDLLSHFYTQALASSVFNNGAGVAVRSDFVRIQRQQQDHADFFRKVLTNANVVPPPTPAFDFSGRKNNSSNPVLFPNVSTDFGAFLKLAQQLEDASAAIYLSQVLAFADNKPLFNAVLRMQSVKARHASHLRTLRRTKTSTVVKSWPSTADETPNPAVLVPSPAGGSAAPVSIYVFEANESQAVSATNTIPFATLLTGTTAVQPRALAEAFDEPLPTRQATALLNLFS